MKKRNFGKAVKTALVALAAVMAALVFSGCDQGVDGGSEEKSSSGLLILSVDDALRRNINHLVSASVIGISRTVHPVFEDSHWDKYVLSFVNTGGGSSPSDITVGKDDSAINGNVITVRVVLGTYNVTVKAYKNDVAVAKGTAEITVQEGAANPQPVIMGPITKAENSSLLDGKLTWEIDLTEVLALDEEKSVFYITDMDGARVDINGTTAGTDIALTAGTNNKDGTGLEIAPGVYRAYIKLEKGGKTPAATLPGEIVYIYAGETSALPKQTFTEANFSVAVEQVTLLNLDGKVPVPATGQTVGSNAISTAQYTGTIAWLAGGSAFTGATFAGETVYTAKVTLTTQPGWTFTGAGNFTYSGGTPTTGDGENGARIVTIVFAATEAVQSQVTLLNLDDKVPVPATGLAVGSNAISTAQYTGTIAWLAGGSAFTGATFAGGTVYTAKVTLTTRPGWTFTGAGNFTYSGGTLTTGDGENGARIVTIVFAATEAVQSGGAGRNKVIEISDWPTRTIVLYQNDTVTLNASGYTGVTWRYHADDTITAPSITLNPNDYPNGSNFYLFFSGTKGGSSASRTLSVAIFKTNRPSSEPYTVTKSTVSNVTTWLGAQEANDNETPYIVKLAGDGGWDISNGEFQNYDLLYDALSGVTGKYVTIDMSDVNVTLITGSSTSPSSKSQFTKLKTAAIVGVVFPKTVTAINTETFNSMSALFYMEFPADVVATVNCAAFKSCGVRTIVIKGEGVTFLALTANYLGTGFTGPYSSATPKAGFYLGASGSTTKWNKVDAFTYYLFS
jgi:hypothetical protein